MHGGCLAAPPAWVLAEPPVAEMMINARQAMGTGTNTLRLRLVADFLAAGLDSRALFPLALAQGVAFIPGVTFSPAGHRSASPSAPSRATAPGPVSSGCAAPSTGSWPWARWSGVPADQHDGGHGQQDGREDYEDAGLDALECPEPAGGLVGDEGTESGERRPAG